MGVISISVQLTWSPAYLPQKGNFGPQKYGMRVKPRSKGVYLIREDGKVVYVGQSQHDLRNRCYRKFQKPDTWRGHQRLSYVEKRGDHVCEVSFLVLPDKEERDLVEAHLIAEFKPRDNVKNEIIELPEGDDTFKPIPDEDVPF